MASRKIKDLHIYMQPVAREFLKQADETLGKYQAFITDGFRSNAEQTEKYAQGRTSKGKIVTYARAGQSPHNYGLAFDIAFRRDGTKEAKWTLSKYKKLANLATELNLEWGGTWSDFKDNPHYQLKNWRKVISNKKDKPMSKKDPLKECLAQHTVLVTEAGIKDKQISAQKGLVTKVKNDKEEADKALKICGTERLKAELRIDELEKPKPIEAIKDPMRYLVSLGIGAALTYAYTQFPILGELQSDQQGLVIFLVGLVVKGLDKLQHERGSSIKLPF